MKRHLPQSQTTPADEPGTDAVENGAGYRFVYMLAEREGGDAAAVESQAMTDAQKVRRLLAFLIARRILESRELK